MKRYNIEVTEKQLIQIRDSVDTITRLSCGQLGNLNLLGDSRLDSTFIDVIKSRMFPDLMLNQSYSVGIDDKRLDSSTEAQELYEIYREIFHYFAIKENHENVYTSETLHYSDQPFIKISEIESSGDAVGSL